MSDLPEKIALVHSLIEHRIMRYMSKSDIVADLEENHNIERVFTETVWERLEQENSDFFRAYNLRLMVMPQINRFNELLKQQAKLKSEQESVSHFESTGSSSSAPLAPGQPVNFGQANQGSSSGSATLGSDANGQNSGQQQENESGGNDNDTPPNN